MILAVVVAGLLFYMLRRLRTRKRRILGELDDRPELNHDRAFNRLAMARREAQILARQGLDVHRAEELIADSQAAFDNRQFDQAYRSAQSAHEALVNARRQGTTGSGASAPATPLNSAAPGAGARDPSGTTPARATTAASPATTPAIPKNRAESQFQIRLLGDELAGLPTRRAQDHTAAEARAFKTQASSAFERGDYTTAFRLALRGRRALGSTVESLPPVGGPGPATPGSANAPPGVSDPTQAAEAAAGAERCPDCGYPALAGDAFCRGCGRPRTPMTCPSCGAPRAGDEPFCGRCGARFA